jgi:hypothetical protein
MVLVQHDRNLAVFWTEHKLDVQPDQGAQTFFSYVSAGYVSAGSVKAGSVDATHHIDDPFLGDVHGVRHDVEQDLVFRLKVVIEAAFGELEGGGDVVHGSGIVSLLLKEARGGAQDFLAWLLTGFLMTFDDSFATHHQ